MNLRIQHLRSFFPEKNLDGILIASPAQIAYLTGYHGFSLVEREAYLLVTTTEQFLITDSRYTDEVKKSCPAITILERNAKTTTARHIEKICKELRVTRLGFEPDILTVAEYKQFKFGEFTLVPCVLKSLRVKKDSAEIAAIQKACQIGDETFTYIQTQIKEGMTEKHVAKLMERFIQENDTELSFATIVAFGQNAAIPHHHTDQTKLQPGDCILLDFGVKYKNYCSDMTRTIFFKSISDEQEKIYQTVKESQQKAINYVNQELGIKNQDRNLIPSPRSRGEGGVIDSEVAQTRGGEGILEIQTANIDQTARNYIISNHYPTIPHGLGHGIGLEVHEAPNLSPLSKDTLTEGMVFSIEPGIYLPETGSTRIEDLFVIQNNKLIQLTNSPKELIII